MNGEKLCKLTKLSVLSGVKDLRILILGPSGQIGHELAVNAKSIGEVITAGRTAADVIFDPLDETAPEKLFSDIKPDIVINAIAYTAVDKAETEEGQAFALNADFPAVLADLCAKTDSLFIHYSTDFVFDGCSKQPWKEDDNTRPLSVYGSSKLAGEKAIQRSSCPSLILRTSWVYGERGNNFLLTMLRLGRERGSLSVVNDQTGSPSYCHDIALATIQLCEQYSKDPQHFRSRTGIYHLTCSGEVTWHGFAKAIFEQAAKSEPLSIRKLLPITSEEYPVAANRPVYSVLDCGKIKNEFTIEMPHWQDSLKRCLKQYYINQQAE